jgi:hypothetical protein
MVRYSQLPNPVVDLDAEMDAAFENSDDEGDEPVDAMQSVNQPLLRRGSDQLQRSATPPLNNQSTSALATASTYNFELPYDVPPPGSPPRPSEFSIPNQYGNSNGQLPNQAIIKRERPQRSLFRRALDTLRPSQPRNGPIGGGMSNDGVFGNVVAKPGGAAPRIGEEESDGPYWAPELAQKDVPPSYATAQADAVPGYWENTILAPSDPSQGGEIIIDGLPIGSLFAFLWNALFSMSFQFVGFLLTHILAGSHAAKFGSRAGLGVTLIQYGFYVRQKPESPYDDGFFSPIGQDPSDPSRQPAAPTITRLLHRTLGSLSSDIDSSMGHHMGMGTSTTTSTNMSDVGGASDWIAFLLMVLGWFIFLSSFLGYWRVKRIERGIRGSVAQSQSQSQQTEEREQLARLVQQFERMFAERRAYRDALRRGFGLGGPQNDDDEIPDLEAGNNGLVWTRRPLAFGS